MGQDIEPDDLVSVAISSSVDLDPIPAAAASSVVGLQTSVSLVPGTLLTRGELETAFAPPAGQSVVGVSLRASQMPASGLTPGQWVSVVLTGQDGEATPVVDPDVAGQGNADDAVGAGAAVPGAGTVLASTVPIIGEASAQDSAGSSSVVVSLEVPTGVAPTLATASTAGEVALVVVPAPPQTASDSTS